MNNQGSRHFVAISKEQGKIGNTREYDLIFWSQIVNPRGLLICSIVTIDSIESELAKLRVTMELANEQFEILDKKLSESGGSSDSEQIARSRKLPPSDLMARAEQCLQWGRLKSRTLDFGNGLFSDSCWNMCLDIYICGLKDEQVTVSAIAHSSGIPMTTAMRYINVMVEQGLLEKSQNPDDNRMIFVTVSPEYQERIATLLSAAPGQEQSRA